MIVPKLQKALFGIISSAFLIAPQSRHCIGLPDPQSPQCPGLPPIPEGLASCTSTATGCSSISTAESEGSSPRCEGVWTGNFNPEVATYLSNGLIGAELVIDRINNVINRHYHSEHARGVLDKMVDEFGNSIISFVAEVNEILRTEKVQKLNRENVWSDPNSLTVRMMIKIAKEACREKTFSCSNCIPDPSQIYYSTNGSELEGLVLQINKIKKYLSNNQDFTLHFTEGIVDLIEGFRVKHEDILTFNAIVAVLSIALSLSHLE